MGEITREALVGTAKRYYENYGPRERMGLPGKDDDTPFFSLIRNFLGKPDLVIHFNTKQCRYRCHFCTLPNRSPNRLILSKHIITQFATVLDKHKEGLHLLRSVTLSNEGSVLDESTYPIDALLAIVEAITQIKSVQEIRFETRMEFVDPDLMGEIQKMVRKKRISIMPGFETADEHIRDDILGKNEPLNQVEEGLDKVAQIGAEFIPYILFKPAPAMSDDAAYLEAYRSVLWLIEQCDARGIPLNIFRINPMYMARGSEWETVAKETPNYRPPKITDVMDLAEWISTSLHKKAWIGLESEGRPDDPSSQTYLAREDYLANGAIIRTQLSMWNRGEISRFDWSKFDL